MPKAVDTSPETTESSAPHQGVSQATPAGAIPLTSLSPAQLKSLKDTLDIEIQALSKHVVDLRYAIRCFEDSQKSLNELGPQAEGREVLVPMTQSVFVPGKLVDTTKVLLDIGTGYHVERSLPQAVKYFESRIQVVGETCSKALKMIAEKRRFAEIIVQQFQEKSGHPRPKPPTS